MDKKTDVERLAEFVDVQLLDVLAQVEAVLRHGRQIQREALRVRGAPTRLYAFQLRAAESTIRDRIEQMQNDCVTLCRVVEDLRIAGQELETFLSASQ